MVVHKNKPLMELSKSLMYDLHAGPAAGIGFYIVDTNVGFYAVLENAAALPLFADPVFYSLDDLLRGRPIPTQTQVVNSLLITQTFHDRHTAIAALMSAGTISPAYLGTPGALPLIAAYTLPANTSFYRYVSAIPDARYAGGNLRAGTYLTSQLELAHADSGFGAVGRFALPLPLPISHVIGINSPPER